MGSGNSLVRRKCLTPRYERISPAGPRHCLYLENLGAIDLAGIGNASSWVNEFLR
jgi:hypothetical protein